MMENRFTAILKKMDWGYVGSVAELPGANTQKNKRGNQK